MEDDGFVEPSEMADVPLESHADAEGIEVGPDPEPGPDTASVYQSLWNTEPSVPLDAVESPWQPDQGGVTRIYRGLMKLGDVEGMPAIADLLVGFAEVLSDRGAFDRASADADGDSESSPDDDSESVDLDGVPTVGDE